MAMWLECLASTFEPQETAYGLGLLYQSPSVSGCALPYGFGSMFSAVVADVQCVHNGVTVYGLPVVDTGPWNWTDPWWLCNDIGGGTPMSEHFKEYGITADNGRVPTNGAGIDLTWGAAERLGVTREWLGPVRVRVRRG